MWPAMAGQRWSRSSKKCKTKTTVVEPGICGVVQSKGNMSSQNRYKNFRAPGGRIQGEMGQSSMGTAVGGLRNIHKSETSSEKKSQAQNIRSGKGALYRGEALGREQGPALASLANRNERSGEICARCRIVHEEVGELAVRHLLGGCR